MKFKFSSICLVCVTVLCGCEEHSHHHPAEHHHNHEDHHLDHGGLNHSHPAHEDHQLVHGDHEHPNHKNYFKKIFFCVITLNVFKGEEVYSWCAVLVWCGRSPKFCGGSQLDPGVHQRDSGSMMVGHVGHVEAVVDVDYSPTGKVTI